MHFPISVVWLKQPERPQGAKDKIRDNMREGIKDAFPKIISYQNILSGTISVAQMGGQRPYRGYSLHTAGKAQLGCKYTLQIIRFER